MSDTSSTPEGAFIPEGHKRSPRPDDPGSIVASVEKPRPASSPQRQGITILIAAIVAAIVAAAVATTISVGVNLWLAKPGGGGNRLMQEGKVHVDQNGDREVFYAEPFAGPPNLELDAKGNMVFIKLKEQKADHFTIQAAVPSEVHWRAEGVRAGK